MKQIPLTQNQFAIVDDEDFEFLNQWKWYALFDKNTQGFYARRNDYTGNKHTSIRMHRIVFNINDPKIIVDHIDGNTLNNCRSNLRVSTVSQNNSNRKPKWNSTSKYLGVHRSNNCRRWVAQISKNQKKIYLGIYKIEEDAANAYDLRAIELHGEFANLNFKGKGI